jgi:hypothetical protein
LALFDTLSDETNWSKITDALDGVGCVFEMGCSAPYFLVLGHNKWVAPLPIFSGTGQQVFGKKIAPTELRTLNQEVCMLEFYHYIA